MKTRTFLQLVLSLLLVVSIVEAKIVHDSLYQIPKTKIAPVIDGVQDAVWKTLDWNMQRFYNVGDPPYEGGGADSGAGLTGMSKAMWDENNLYVLFYSVDDIIVDIPTNATWDQDAIWICIDGDNSKIKDWVAPDPGGGLASGDFTFIIPHWLKGKEVGHSGTVFGTTFDTTGVQFKIRDVLGTEGFPGWMTEIKIPLANLGIDGAAAVNQKIGWELQQDECDNASVGRQSMSKWWSNSNNSWTDASIWGTAILSDRSVDTVFEMSKLPVGAAIAVDGLMDPIYRQANAITTNLFRVGDPPTLETVDTDPMFGGFITAYPVYDETDFYILYDVVDQIITDIPSNPSWNQDAVWIYIDGTNDHSTESSLKAGQYSFIIPHWLKGKEAGHLGTVFGTNFDTTGIQFKITDHNARGNDGVLTEEGSGYNVELKIPLAALGIDGSATGAKLGFELQMDNCNDARFGRQGMEKWWNSSNNSGANAGIWGTAKLGSAIGTIPIITPTNEWVSFWSDSSLFDGQPLKVGDVVDAFDPQGIQCGTYTVTTPGGYGLMAVYRDDGVTTKDEGAQPGDVITFKINGYPVKANGPASAIWTANGDVKEVNLSGRKEFTVTMPLRTNWNLVSWNVDAPVDTASVIFGPIASNLRVALSFENGGSTYDPTIPVEFNTLKEADHLHGYWLKMKAAGTLNVSGAGVDPQTPIGMESGYNLVSYLPTRGDSVTHAIGSVMTNTTVVLGFDAVGMTFDPSIPPEFNTLKVMRPGYGYWVKMKAAGTLIYPLTSPKPGAEAGAAIVAGNTTESMHPTREWMSVWGDGITIQGKVIPRGAKITAKTKEGAVCGEGEMWEEGKFGLMAVYKDDAETQEVEGVKEGEEFTLTIGDYQLPKSIKWTGFGEVVNLNTLITGIAEMGTLPTEYGLEQNYPNPFNPTTTIRYALPKSGRVTLRVYDILGKEVATLIDGEKEAGYHSIEWNASRVASGIYFYRITVGDFHEVMKMQALK